MSIRKPIASLFVLCAVLFVAELGFGAIAPSLGVDASEVEGLRTYLQEGHAVFEPFPYSGFVAQTTSEQEKDPTRPKDWAFKRPKREGIIRVACLGGSTTHGKYPRLMKRELENELGQKVEVMNWGVPGWTTQETMVNYFTTVQDYDPDIVVIHHALNDVAPRRRKGYRSDYAHWRRTWQDPELGDLERWLIQKSDIYAGFVTKALPAFTLANFANHPFRGVKSNAPAAKMPKGTEKGFRRNIETLVEFMHMRGTKVCLVTMPYKLSVALRGDGEKRLWAAGLEEHNQILREVAEKLDCLLVDCEAGAKAQPEEANMMFLDRVHVTWKGARVKAKAIADALLAEGWIRP